MSCARLRTELLRTRDARETSLRAAVKRGTSVAFLSTAIPGPDKTPAGSAELFHWALRALSELPGPVDLLERGCDALGHFAILNLPWPARRIKLACIDLEERCPQTRLLDLDVYAPSGKQLGRGELGLPARPCLLCARPATQCMRLRRHDLPAVINHAHRLLQARFHPPAG